MSASPPSGADPRYGLLRRGTNRADATGSRSYLLGTAVLLFCGICFYFTQPRIYADTANYALHLVQHWQGHVQPGRDPLWDFGHVVWRPLGNLLWNITGGPQAATPIVRAAYVLIGISMAATCLGGLLFYFLTANYTGKLWIGFVSAIGLLSTHAFLNYAQTGTSYIPGTVCQIAALFWFERQLRYARDRDLSTWLTPGILLGLSVVLWFPYLLTIPSVLLFALLYRTRDFRDRLSLVLRSTAVAILIVVGVYSCAIFFNRITSFAMAHEWYLRSQHRESQTRGYLRVITGIPRGFFFLGDVGVMWKRLLFQPGAGAHGLAFALLVIQTGWKLIAVYAFILFVLIQLATSRASRIRRQELLPVLLVAAVPVLLFAIIFFEAGPIERYLPVFPMLFLGAAHVLDGRRVRRVAVLSFFVLMLAVNVVAFSRAASRGRWSETASKLAALSRQSSHQDIVFLFSYQDDAFRMSEERPLDPLFLQAPMMSLAAELQTQQIAHWQQSVAGLILKTWNDGHQVWISKRLLAPAPKPEWNWVDGDDVRIRWRDLPAFFSALKSVAECCGPEGYVLLARTLDNEDLLRAK